MVFAVSSRAAARLASARAAAASQPAIGAAGSTARRSALLVFAGATTGLLAGVALYNKDSLDWSARPSFLPLLQLDAAPLKRAGPTKIDPSTSIAFPTRLTPTSLRSTDEVLSLVGLGVRTVSFLKVKVYCAGFYVPEGHWWSAEGMGSEETMQTFLSSKTPCAIRIIPTRNTGFDHLRDGFVRAIQGRMKVLTKRGDVGDAELDRVDASLVMFKSLFATRTANKGEELLLVKLPSGGVAVEFEGEVLGKVEDPLVARELFMAYFLEKGANSEKMRESVLEGFALRRMGITDIADSQERR